MQQVIERPMTEDDRKRLLDCMPLKKAPSPFRTREFKVMIASEIAGLLIAVVILIALKKVNVTFVIAAALLIGLLRWFFSIRRRALEPLREWRVANQKVMEFHNAVKAAQTVRVRHVKAEAVVQMEHDEGMVCLYDLGGSQTYWIDPVDMIPGRASGAWPNSEFEVMEIPGRVEEIGPFCLGKKMKARELVAFEDLFACYDYEPPADGVINQSLDDFLKEAEAKNMANSEKMNS